MKFITFRYTRAQGHPRLVKELAAEFSPLFNRNIDPMSEIVTGVGAYEVIYAAITAFINEGDEVPQDLIFVLISTRIEYEIFGKGSHISTNQRRESTVFSLMIG